MFGLKDLLSLLDRWDRWKLVDATPERTDALEKRVAALEEKLSGKWPADVCLFCGERASRLEHTIPHYAQKVARQDWRCTACKRVENRIVKA